MRSNWFLWALMGVSLAFVGCRHPGGVTGNEGVTGNALRGTDDDNGIFGQQARCEQIYHNNQSHNECRQLLGSYCDPDQKSPGACRSALYAPGVYDTTIRIMRKVLKKDVGRNEVAQRISKHTRTLLTNMMRDPVRPIHPAAFFAVIKDYETSTNLFEWGVSGFRCLSPDYCSDKCVPLKDCARWCERHGKLLEGSESCLNQCRAQGYYCDSRCLGLFQVDPELENFEQISGASGKFSLKLREEEKISWDFEKVCGAEGLDLIGEVGGPDFCALLYWLMEGYGGERCALFSEYSGKDPSVDPCKNPNYTWTIDTFRRGHRVYVQLQKHPEAWLRRYQGFFPEQGEGVMGYEHCAAHGYEGYDYTQASQLDIPGPSLRASVRAFACQIGLPLEGSSGSGCVHPLVEVP